MYERFDELDSNMFGQGDVMSTQICECSGSNSQKQLPVCDHALLSTAVEITVLNSPSLFPFDPNFVTNFPISSNTRTLWFEVSQTIRRPALLTDK